MVLPGGARSADCCGRACWHSCAAAARQAGAAALLLQPSEDQTVLVLDAGASGAARIRVLQLPDEPGAAALLPPLSEDKTVLFLEAGASGVSLALLDSHTSYRGPSTTPGAGAKAIDDRLVAFFAKEFTEKTKEPLAVPAQNEEDARAERKLRLAVDATKRTLSAGVGGAAACSVESLKAGLDLAGSINRLRFDLEVAPVYRAVASAVHALLKENNLEPLQVDAVLLVGGSARLPGLISQLESVFPERTAIEHAVDPTEVLARGAALQARALADAEVDLAAREAATTGAGRIIGLFFPGGEGDALTDANWVPLVLPQTPLPARRTVSFGVPKDADRVGFEVVEARQEVFHPPKPERAPKEPVEGEDEEEDEDDEQEEEELEPELRTHKEGVLGALVLDVSAKEKVVVEVVVALDGAVNVAAWQEGGERTTLVVPAP